MSLPRILAISHRDSPRTQAFAAAALTCNWRVPLLADWQEVLAGEAPALTEAGGRPLLLRLESPGKSWPVEKRLLQIGANEIDEEDPDGTRWRRLSGEECERLADDPGRIQPSRQWYLGFRAVLKRLDRTAAETGAEWFQPPADVLTFFDKAACQVQLYEEGLVCVPDQLGVLRDFDDLLEKMAAIGHRRIFLKLCHGSSASGAVAFETSGPRMQAFSTTEMVHGPDGELRLYNSRRVRRYTAPAEIRTLIDALCAERAMAEGWIPKAGWQNRRFDMRIVVIGGEARHVVARLADGPFTNLQLGAKRASAEELRGFLGEQAWAGMLGEAVMTMCTFPHSLHGAVDLALEVGTMKPYVLEVNAFGDYLPNLLCDRRSTYEWELAEAAKWFQPAGIRSGKLSP